MDRCRVGLVNIIASKRRVRIPINPVVLRDCLATTLVTFFGVGIVAADENLRAPRVAEVRPNNHDIVKWVEMIGSDGGTPAVSKDYVVLGTDNRSPRVARGDYQKNAVAVMCFERKTGQFRWQILHARLSDPASDMGVATVSEPVIKDGRVFYQNNRGELVCASLRSDDDSRKSGEIRWKFDFVSQLGVFKRDAMVNPLPSPLLDGNRLYCVTGNGSNYGSASQPKKGAFVPRPEAPSFVAIDANTGKLLWKNAAPGGSICYGQWGSPTKLVVGPTVAILFPGGDGILYALSAETGKVMGSVNLNAPGTKPWDYQQRGDLVFCSHRPLVAGQMIYLGVGQDQEIPSKHCAIISIDGKQLLSGSSQEKVVRWVFRNPEVSGIFGEMAIAANRLYAISCTGCLVCLSTERGDLRWLANHEGSTRFPGIVVNNGYVYVPTDDSIWVYEDNSFSHVVFRYQFEEMPMGKPVVTENELFATTSGHLWCLKIKH